MTRCTHCAQKLPKRALVCPYCGFPVPPEMYQKPANGSNLGAILPGVIGGVALVIILGISALFGYKGRWLDFGPRRSHSVTAIAYRLDDGLPYMSLYIGRPDEHVFTLPPGPYYIEAFDQTGQGISLGSRVVKVDDGRSAFTAFPRDFTKSPSLLSGQETGQVKTLAEFLLLVDYARLSYLEIISNEFSTTPYGVGADIPLSALEPMETLFAEMAKSDKQVTEAAQVFQARALATISYVPGKATLSVKRWFNVVDKLRAFFGLNHTNAESARNEILMVYDALPPDQRAEAFDMVDPNNRGGAQTYEEFVQKIKDGEISDNTALGARREFHGDPFYAETVQNAVPGMNRPHINIAHQEGSAAVAAGAELYVEIIKSVLTTQFPDIKNGFEYAEKADKWSNYVRDLLTDPTKAFENYTTDQIKEYLSDQIKADLGEMNPGLDDDEIGEIAGALADRITQQAVEDVKAGGGMIVDAVGGLIKTEPADTAETQPADETEVEIEKATETETETETETVTETPEPIEPTAEPVRNFGGSWAGGGACSEGDDPPFRWNVSLEQDASGNVQGTISFHACPGGGAAFYSVTGQATSEETLILQGSKTGGRGGLGGNTPGTVQFSIKYEEAPTPNYGG